MSRRELKAFSAVTAACTFAVLAVGIGLKLLGASSEVIAVGFVLVVAFGGLGGGFAFDRYSTPPDVR